MNRIKSLLWYFLWNQFGLWGIRGSFLFCFYVAIFISICLVTLLNFVLLWFGK